MAIKNGDKVTVHYTGRLLDGTEFDSSKKRGPLTFVLGEGNMIAGFEKAILGKNEGDKFTVTIPPAEAYGEYDPELVFKVEREKIPEHIPLKPGTRLQLANEQGQMDVLITKVDDDAVTLDANSRLAGKDLVFDLDIEKVEPQK